MFWYYPGFYFGLGGLYGFPSYGFSFWFYNGGYYQRYPHLYRQFGIYYRDNATRAGLATTVSSRGFINVATSHYRPEARMSSNSPFLYNRPSNVPHLNNVNPTRRFTPHPFQTQSRGYIGGRAGAMGAGFGSGFHGGLHGHR
jgi:hypothetical protein